jgi:hypothetical protein
VSTHVQWADESTAHARWARSPVGQKRHNYVASRCGAYATRRNSMMIPILGADATRRRRPAKRGNVPHPLHDSSQKLPTTKTPRALDSTRRTRRGGGSLQRRFARHGALARTAPPSAALRARLTQRPRIPPTPPPRRPSRPGAERVPARSAPAPRPAAAAGWPGGAVRVRFLGPAAPRQRPRGDRLGSSLDPPRGACALPRRSRPRRLFLRRRPVAVAAPPFQPSRVRSSSRGLPRGWSHVGEGEGIGGGLRVAFSRRQFDLVDKIFAKKDNVQTQGERGKTIKGRGGRGLKVFGFETLLGTKRKSATN